MTIAFLKLNLFTLSALYSILPTLMGLAFFTKLKPYFKVLIANLFLGNILMLVSNTDILISKINSHYLFYLSILISGICFPFIFGLLLKKYQIFSFSVFIIVFLVYDFYNSGFKEMNVLPFIFIDIFNIMCCLLCFKSDTKFRLSLKLFLGVQLAYSFYDVLVNFASSYFYNYLNEYFFNLIWFTLNPIIGFFYYSVLTYIFFLSAKEITPKFENFPDFK